MNNEEGEELLFEMDTYNQIGARPVLKLAVMMST